MKNSGVKISNFLVRILSGTRFVCVVVIILVLQSLWLALSFRFPMLYDEAFHVDAIKLFAQQLSPIIEKQPIVYDMYGSLTHGGATLFHYLLSFPYRLISVFTHNLAILVISLRIICIALVAVGIYVYNRLFRLIGVKQIYINVSLLLFVLLPIVPFVAATVNYDNMLFPLTGLFFLSAVHVILSKRIKPNHLLAYILIGCVASLVKTMFLVLFAVSTIALITVLAIRHKRSLGHMLLRALKTIKGRKSIALAISAGLVTVLFIVVFFGNLLQFGSVQPSCQKLLGDERCAASTGIIRDQSAYVTRDTRPLIMLPDYVSMWTVQMVNWIGISGARTSDQGTVITSPLPVFYTTVYVLGIMGVGVILFAWKILKPNSSWRYLVGMSVALIGAIFLQNLFTYLHLHVAYAIQPRYLLTILPILITLAVTSLGFILKGRQRSKVLILLITLLLFTQGGGIVTHILSSRDNWYWQNTTVQHFNDSTRKLLDHLVKNS